MKYEITNDNINSYDINSELVSYILKIINIEYYFNLIENKFTNNLELVRPDRKYKNSFRKEYKDIISRFTSYYDWYNSEESLVKFKHELSEHIRVDFSDLPETLDEIFSLDLEFSFYLTSDNTLFLEINGEERNIDNYKMMVKRYLQDDVISLNLSIIVLIYYNMRSDSGSNWSPESIYTSMKYYLEGTLVNNFIPYDLKQFNNLVKVECYSSLNNNQTFLRNFPLEAKCMLNSKFIKELLPYNLASTVYDPFPKGVLNFLSKTKFSVCYLMLNPVYSEPEIKNCMLGLVEIINTHRDKCFIVEGSLPYWSDIFNETNLVGYTFRQLNFFADIISNDNMRNDDFDKKINFNLVAFQGLYNPFKNKSAKEFLSNELTFKDDSILELDL